MKLSEADAYRIEIVRQDLSFLQNEWDQSVTEDSLRRSSNVFRSLLVEGQFGKAWRALGLDRQPVVVAPDLQAIVRGMDVSRIGLAMAGGAFYQGINLAATLQVDFALSPEEARRIAAMGPFAPYREFTLSSFLDSMCIISQGQALNRRELIRYVANKLGGVHLDSTRNEANDMELRFKAIDSLLKGVQVLGIRPAYFELLSIGQVVARAPDTNRFLVMAGYARTA